MVKRIAAAPSWNARVSLIGEYALHNTERHAVTCLVFRMF